MIISSGERILLRLLPAEPTTRLLVVGVGCRPTAVCKQRCKWERCSRCCEAVAEDGRDHRRAAGVLREVDAGIAQVHDRVVLDHPPIRTNMMPSIENSAW